MPWSKSMDIFVPHTETAHDGHNAICKALLYKGHVLNTFRNSGIFFTQPVFSWRMLLIRASSYNVFGFVPTLLHPMAQQRTARTACVHMDRHMHIAVHSPGWCVNQFQRHPATKTNPYVLYIKRMSSSQCLLCYFGWENRSFYITIKNVLTSLISSAGMASLFSGSGSVQYILNKIILFF